MSKKFLEKSSSNAIKPKRASPKMNKIERLKLELTYLGNVVPYFSHYVIYL